MSLTTEQTTKLRSLVKTKLVELGEYVDDQLTDYVIIMVTNKKSEKQMADDLELFLGGIENATNFSSWLHQTIRNLIAESTSQVNYKKQNSKTSSRTASVNQPEPSDELAIQIDSNEFNDEHQQMRTEPRTAETQSAHRPITRSHMVPKFANTTPLITKPIHSCIGAVIKRNEEKSPPSASQSTDLNPARRRRRSSSSSESNGRSRRRSVGSKNMLLKAVDDANKSVSAKTDRSARRSIGDERIDDESSRRKAEQTSLDPSLIKRLSFPEENRVKRLKTASSSRQPDSRPVDKRQVVRVHDEEPVVDNINESSKPNEPAGGQETKFFVTLTGIDETQFAKSAAGKTRRGGLFEIDAQDDELIYEGEAGYEDFDMNDGQPDQQLVSENLSQDGVEMMEVGMDQDSSRFQPGFPPKHKHNRSSFWPNSDTGEPRQYLNPNKPITMYPSYPKPHFVTCRYDGFCTRPDCPFIHSVKKTAPIVEPPQTGDETKQGDESPTKSTGHKITINKIQSPYYSLVNTKTAVPGQDLQMGPQRQFPFAKTYYNPAFSFAPAPNKYKLINRTNTVPTTPVYGNLWKSPKGMYPHANLPPKSQLKWVAPSATTPNKAENPSQSQSQEADMAQTVTTNENIQ